MSDAEIAFAKTQGLAVLGNTYPVKDELKLLGCGWDQISRVWVAPTKDVLELANAIVARGPLGDDNAPTFTPEQIVQALRQATPGMLIGQLRRHGLEPQLTAAVTLADAVAGWPPTFEEVVDGAKAAFEFDEFGIGFEPEAGTGRDPADIATALGANSIYGKMGARAAKSSSASQFATRLKDLRAKERATPSTPVVTDPRDETDDADLGSGAFDWETVF